MKVYKKEKYRVSVFETYDKLLEMWDVDLNEFDVKTRYGSTHVISFGDSSKQPLVLFHGVGDNSALMWIYNAKELGKHFRVYAIDTLGGPGKSIPNDNYNKTFDQIKWVDDVLLKLNIDKTYMAGVSNGSYITHHYGIKRPDRVIKMVCMAGGVATIGSPHPLKQMLKVFLPEAIFPTKNNVNKLIRKLTGENSGVFTENPVVMEHYQYLIKGFNNMAMAYHKIEMFSDEQIKNISGKSMFLCGDADPLRDKVSAEAAFKKHKLDFKIFKGVGHGINHEISDEINKTIIDFLK